MSSRTQSRGSDARLLRVGVGERRDLPPPQPRQTHTVADLYLLGPAGFKFAKLPTYRFTLSSQGVARGLYLRAPVLSRCHCLWPGRHVTQLPSALIPKHLPFSRVWLKAKSQWLTEGPVCRGSCLSQHLGTNREIAGKTTTSCGRH